MIIKIIKRIKQFMAKITISTVSNNSSVIVSVHDGHNVTITNGKVIVDGNDVTPQMKNISISVEGSVDTLTVDACNYVKVSNTVNKLTTTSGDVTCGDVTGNVQSTSGDIECGDVGGDVRSTSGDVTAKTIKGRVSTTSGDISGCSR
jgi:hypothetical protein